MGTVIDNKKIMKNTIYLYFRMFFIMLVGLFSVRIVLRELGVIDYGIYNVVGSVVALCSFLTGSLTAASNRFFSREIVKRDISSLNKCFCLNLTVFGVLVIIAIVLLETIGLWYVNNKMIIPLDRLFAANVVYQLSVITLASTFIMIPYNALMITHEHMSAFAYIGIIEAILRLGVALTLIIFTSDKLIFFAFASVVINVLITVFYFAYCRKHYPESKYHLYWNKTEFSEIFKFISWYFFGSVSSVIRSQGINILLNSFFNPAINAARAVAFQVEGAIKRFSDGYFTAAKPQLYKSHANGEYQGLNILINRITLICVFLMAVFAIPLAFNANTVLSVWLGDVPDKSVIFLQLVLIDSVLNVSSEPIILTILATGRQSLYQVVEFTLRVLTLPLSYVLLRYGAAPEITVVVCILFSILAVIARALMLKRSMKEFDLRSSFYAYLRMYAAVGLVIIFICFIQRFSLNSMSFFLVSSASSVIMLMITFYFIALDRFDRQYVYDLVKNSKKIS